MEASHTGPFLGHRLIQQPVGAARSVNWSQGCPRAAKLVTETKPCAGLSAGAVQICAVLQNSAYIAQVGV